MTTTPDLVKSLHERWAVAFAAEPDDSAGGGMVVTAMLLARDRGLPLPAAGMPLSPWFDFEATGASQKANAGTDDAIGRLADWVRPHLGL